MNPHDLQNKKILILDAVTEVNSVAKKSRITNTELMLGSIVYERIEGSKINDGVFFEPVLIDGKSFSVFYRFMYDGELELTPTSLRGKSINIKKFETK